MDMIEKNILEEADTGKKKSGKKKFVIIAVIVAAFLGLACAIIIPKALSRTFVIERIELKSFGTVNDSANYSGDEIMIYGKKGFKKYELSAASFSEQCNGSVKPGSYTLEPGQEGALSEKQISELELLIDKKSKYVLKPGTELYAESDGEKLAFDFEKSGIKAEKIPPEEIEYKWDAMKFHVTELVLNTDENLQKDAKGKRVLLNTEIIEGKISFFRVEKLLMEENRIKLKDINPVGCGFIPNYSDFGGFGNVKGFSVIFDVPEDYKLDLSDINVTETD